MRNLRLAAAIAATALTSGCAAAASSTVCIPLIAYKPAFQTQVADEIAAAPADAGWPTMVADYGELRARVRAAAACD